MGHGPSLSRFHYHIQQDTPDSVGLLWTNDQPDAETSTCQHTTLKRNRHPCPLRNSNPQSQQAGGRRITPYTAQLLASELPTVIVINTQIFIGSLMAAQGMGGQRKWLIGSVMDVQGEPTNCTSWSNRRRQNKWRDRTAGAGLAALLVHSKHVTITRSLKSPKSPLQLPLVVAGPLQKTKKVRVNYRPLYSYNHWFWKTPTSAESFWNWWAYKTQTLLYVYPAAIVFSFTFSNSGISLSNLCGERRCKEINLHLYEVSIPSILRTVTFQNVLPTGLHVLRTISLYTEFAA